jgi:hypothetical protein
MPAPNALQPRQPPRNPNTCYPTAVHAHHRPLFTARHPMPCSPCQPPCNPNTCSPTAMHAHPLLFTALAAHALQPATLTNFNRRPCSPPAHRLLYTAQPQCLAARLLTACYSQPSPNALKPRQPPLKPKACYPTALHAHRLLFTAWHPYHLLLAARLPSSLKNLDRC